MSVRSVRRGDWSCRFLGLTGWVNLFLQFTGFRVYCVEESDGTISDRWAPPCRIGW